MYKQLETSDNSHYEENEGLKQKSIEEFTSFIQNHSYIKLHAGIDDSFILGYLRARRYVMPKVKELYERSLLFVKQNPEICLINEETFAKALKLYDSGSIIVMKDRDASGRRIVLCVTRRLDTSKITIDDITRLTIIVFFVILLEEDTQKNGIIFIGDLTGLSINHVKLVPYKILKNVSSYMNVNSVRVKEMYAVGVPGIAVQIFKAISFAFDDKNKKRLQVMGDVSNLWKFVDQNLMPKEYGGKCYSESESLTDFKKIMIERIDKVMELTNNLEIDVKKAKKYHKIKSFSKSKKDDDYLLEFD